MAKRWDPQGKPVGPQERVGRRLLDLPELAGASEDQYYSRIKFMQFWDKDTGEVSLDRLGRSNIEPKVRNYLIPRAKKHAASFAKPKTFEGWAHIKADELLNSKYPPNLVLKASPDLIAEGEDEYNENIYHAHIDKRVSTVTPTNSAASPGVITSGAFARSTTARRSAIC